MATTDSGVAWCPRCGIDLDEPELPCPDCWPAQADSALIDRLAGHATAALDEMRSELASTPVSSFEEALFSEDPAVTEAGFRVRPLEATARAALRLLAQIDDPQAATKLRAVAGHPEPRVRAAALRSLAWSGDHSDVPRAIEALRADSEGLRLAAVDTLAELGGPDAADALARRLDHTRGEELEAIVAALAWLRDPRALPPARQLAPYALRTPGNERRNAAWALVRLGRDEDRLALRESLLDLATDPSILYQAGGKLANALSGEFPDEIPELIAWLSEREHHDRPRPALKAREPLGAREVAKLQMAELLTEPDADARPQAKFGGQPDWIREPRWPYTAAGRPLIFYGQLPLLDGPARMAYIFIGPDESWEPLAEGNTVVVQPGPAPQHISCRASATGPQLFEGAPQPPRFRAVPKARPYERFARLTPGADPKRWEWPEREDGVVYTDVGGDWNKVGGTGLWLQGEPVLPGEGWRFAFQFTAGWAGHELADGAQCYGFVNTDGRAALAWDCH